MRPGARPQRAADRGSVRQRRARPRAIALAALVAATVVVLDRLTKQAVESSVSPGEERSFLPGVEIVHTRNNGVAFGLLGGAHVYLTIALAIAVVLALVYFARRAGSGPTWLPVGMVIGGALGNVIDRVRLGSVTDFVKLPLGWPPFNLADASITIGVIVLALLAGFGESGDEDEGGDPGGRERG